jgi:hypothetical protein
VFLTVIFQNAKFHSNNTDNDDTSNTSINFPRHFPNHGLLEHSAEERKEKKRGKFKAATEKVKHVKQILGKLQMDKVNINKKFLYIQCEHLEKKLRENNQTYQFHVVRKYQRGKQHIYRISNINTSEWREQSKCMKQDETVPESAL